MSKCILLTLARGIRLNALLRRASLALWNEPGALPSPLVVVGVDVVLAVYGLPTVSSLPRR